MMHDILRGANRTSRLIAASRSWEKAREMARRRLDEEDIAELSALAIDYLANFPFLSGACVPMSAGFSALLTEHSNIPAVVAAGSLAVGKATFYAPNDVDALPRVFDETRLDFDGHAWVLAGDHIVDLSIFRTAYSCRGPAGLREAIAIRFGEGQGVFLSRSRSMRRDGMTYQALYVLTEEQEKAIAKGAQAIVTHFGKQVSR